MKFKNIIILFSAIFLLAVSFSCIEPPRENSNDPKSPTYNPYWFKTYGTTGDNRAFSVCGTSDGGYAVAGLSKSVGAGEDYDMWVLKLNSSGKIEWEKTFGETGEDDNAEKIIQTSDGGYLIGGFKNGTVGDMPFEISGGDIWVLKLNSSGTVEWQNTYGPGKITSLDEFNAQLTNRFYLTATYASTNSAILVTGLDPDTGDPNGSGIIIEDTATPEDLDEPCGTIVLSNGTYNGYIVAARLNDIFWIKKFDSINSSDDWEYTFSAGATIGRLAPSSISQTSDNGFILIGYAMPSSNDSSFNVAIKFDSAGTVEWHKTFRNTSLTDYKFDISYNIVQTSDGGYIISSTTNYLPVEPVVDAKYWLIKLSSAGESEWQKLYSKSDENDLGQLCKIIRTLKGYIAAGYTYSLGAGLFDIALLYMDNNGNIPGTSIDITSTAIAAGTLPEITPTSVSISDTPYAGTATATTVTGADTTAVINTY